MTSTPGAPAPGAAAPAVPDRAERRAARLDDPRFEDLRTRPVRRRLVLGLAALLVVETGTFLAMDHVTPVPGLVALLAGLLVVLVAFVLLFGMLKASTRGVEELPRSVLDERERQVRGEVYARSYRLGFAALTALLAGAVLWRSADLPVTTGLLTAATVVTFHVAVVLPTLVAAWLAD